MKFLNGIGRFLGLAFSIDGDKDVDLQFKILPLNWLIVGYIVVALWTSWFNVDRDENATVCVFGKYYYTAEPGLNFKLPVPFSTADETSVLGIRRLELGFRTIDAGPPSKTKEVPEESLLLTSDLNISNMNYIIQYRASDAYKWQFRVQNPELLMRQLGEASMRQVVGKTSFDAVVTFGKQEVEQQAMALLQELCDEIDFGVKVVAVQLQDVHPPKEVVAAFKDVTDAKEDRESSIHNANKYRNKLIPDAKGQAEQILNEAKGYASRTVMNAKGNAERFTKVRKEYEANPTITKTRLTLDVLEKIIPQGDVIIDGSEGLGLLKHLNIKPETAKK